MFAIMVDGPVKDDRPSTSRRVFRQLAGKPPSLTIAREVHPDKGGSDDVMQRLNAVRAHLQQCV